MLNNIPAAQDFYKDLLKTTHAIILLIDPESGDVKDANAAALEFYGYSKSEILALNITEINSFSEAEVKAELQRAKEEKRNHCFFKHKLKNGDLRDVDVFSGPIRIGEQTLLLSFIHDISDRVRIEEELRKSEERFRNLIDNSNDAIFVADGTTGILVDANEAGSRMIKRPLNEIVGMHQTQLHPPEEHDSIAQKFKDYVEKPLGVLFGVHVIDSEGVRIPVSINAKVYIQDGKPFIQGVFRDMSPLMKADEALKASERRFREFVEFAPDGIIILDKDAYITVVNMQAERSFGYLKGELIGHSIDELVPDRHRKIHSEQCAMFRSDASSREMGGGLRLAGRRKDGSDVPVEISLGPVETPEGQITLVMIRDITERVKIEEALQVQKEQAQKYLDVAGVMMLAINSDDEVTMINRRGCEILGYPADEIVGKKWTENFIPPSNRADVEKVFKKITDGKSEEVRHYENPILTKSGDVRDMAWNNTVIREDGGHITSVLSSGEDITERKKAEQELILRAEQLNALTKISRDINAEHDLQVMKRMIAEAAVALTSSKMSAVGLSENDTIVIKELLSEGKWVNVDLEFPPGKGINGHVMSTRSSYLSNDISKDRFADLEEANKLGINSMLVVPIIGKNRVIQGTVEVASRSDGEYSESDRAILENLAEIAAIAMENAMLLEEIRSKEEELIVVVARLNTILNASPLAIAVLDQDSNITLWNKTAEEIFGFMEADILGKRVPYVSDEYLEGHYTLLEKVRQGEIIRNFVTKRQRKDGTIFDVSLSIAPSYDNEGALCEFVAVISDISEQKSLEAQFMHAQKMEAIGRLAGGIAHDFNNLLTAIIGNAELLLMDLDPEDPRYEEALTIKNTGDKAAKLTRQLLTFSKNQITQPRILNLNEIVQGMSNVLVRIIGEDIKQVLELAPDLKGVHGDAGQLEQVILNLAVNARDAMPGGGTITIRTANFYVGEDHVRLNPSTHRGDYVSLEIEDDGPGIPDDVKEHIFEPFFTTRKSGTGLGLSTVYGIIKQLGGTINIRSGKTQGTVFTILIPTFADEDKVSSADHDVQREDLKGTETIWVLEDEPSLRRLATTVLSNLGYTVKVFSSARDLLDDIKTDEGQCQLLVTDTLMDDPVGIEALTELEKRHPDSKILYTSGYPIENFHERGIMVNATNFLQKPYTPAQLVSQIRQLL